MTKISAEKGEKRVIHNKHLEGFKKKKNEFSQLNP